MSSPGDGRGEIPRAALDEVSTDPAAPTTDAVARVCTERLCTRSAQKVCTNGLHQRSAKSPSDLEPGVLRSMRLTLHHHNREHLDDVHCEGAVAALLQFPEQLDSSRRCPSGSRRGHRQRHTVASSKVDP